MAHMFTLYPLQKINLKQKNDLTLPKQKNNTFDNYMVD